ncbi:hypothetical protein CkaCkLH20_12588 [Colletotrichum karsti]|uniref:Uncharacterized protein n=1 Tax=Colletotrichum karsti TaxID=1095194 RepID=A0A9P6HTN4_9PEZI|nr:uncharacterized protein CkaCkLH20_12588 [Colletotrichum karsti]KAF9869979.1 hypothetical protein CkaCkLH20_12588 [Colletotrichum karsti]
MNFASSTTVEPPPLMNPGVEHLAEAPGSLARSILVALCEDQNVRAQALRQLDRLMRFEADVRGHDVLKSPNNSISNSPSPKKRKATGDPKICVQCDGIFTEDDNMFGSCSYHTGEMELMDETVIDLLPAERALYDLDTEDIRARHPEAFRWWCCYAMGNKPGCRRGRHESNPDKSRKGRGVVTDLDVDPLMLDMDDDDDNSSSQGIGGGGSSSGSNQQICNNRRLR